MTHQTEGEEMESLFEAIEQLYMSEAGSDEAIHAYNLLLVGLRALEYIADPLNHHHKPDYMRPEEVAHSALQGAGWPIELGQPAAYNGARRTVADIRATGAAWITETELEWLCDVANEFRRRTCGLDGLRQDIEDAVTRARTAGWDANEVRTEVNYDLERFDE